MAMVELGTLRNGKKDDAREEFAGGMPKLVLYLCRRKTIWSDLCKELERNSICPQQNSFLVITILVMRRFTREVFFPWRFAAYTQSLSCYNFKLPSDE